MDETNAARPWKWMKKPECPHLQSLVSDVTSSRKACEACGETRDLRICLTCGHVGCCESRAAHDTEHFQRTGHPFIKPHRSEGDWLWCYKCYAFLQ